MDRTIVIWCKRLPFRSQSTTLPSCRQDASKSCGETSFYSSSYIWDLSMVYIVSSMPVLSHGSGVSSFCFQRNQTEKVTNSPATLVPLRKYCPRLIFGGNRALSRIVRLIVTTSSSVKHWLFACEWLSLDSQSMAFRGSYGASLIYRANSPLSRNF